jgi:hypothetical protein
MPDQARGWLPDQVQALGEVACRSEVLRAPDPPPPARTHAALRPGAPEALRTAALLAAWLGAGAGRLLAALDRRGTLGSADDLQARACLSSCLIWRRC